MSFKFPSFGILDSVYASRDLRSKKGGNLWKYGRFVLLHSYRFHGVPNCHTDYGPEGRGFESLTACHPETVEIKPFPGFFFCPVARLHRHYFQHFTPLFFQYAYRSCRQRQSAVGVFDFRWDQCNSIPIRCSLWLHGKRRLTAPCSWHSHASSG